MDNVLPAMEMTDGDPVQPGKELRVLLAKGNALSTGAMEECDLVQSGEVRMHCRQWQ